MSQSVRHFLKNEVDGLRSRLRQVQPFALTMPMVAAANVSHEALRAVTDHLLENCRKLDAETANFLQILRLTDGPKALSDADLQARFVRLKLRFNAILDQFDIFADVISQRAEHGAGVWIAGLDVLAADALRLPGGLFQPPPVMCFLERGHGAAIRKARTRLPGGDLSPVAVIQVPRERMVGGGVAASLIHEVGHQGAASLDLVKTLRDAMQKTPVSDPEKQGWRLLNRWISEIIADFWALAHLGIGASLGLMGVVSLPRYFMFRINEDDPHPFPWIRAELSFAFGRRLFPDPKWAEIRRLWHRIYPTDGLPTATLTALKSLELAIPRFVQLVISHRNPKTQGRPLAELFPIRTRQPAALRRLFISWKNGSARMPLNRPSLIFAVLAQARADSLISLPEEGRMLERLLQKWAIMRTENRLPLLCKED